MLILNQKNSNQAFPSYFLNIHFNINLPCKLRSSKWVLSFGCPHQSPVCLLHVRATCTAQLILLDLCNDWWEVQIVILVHLVQFASYRWRATWELHVCSAAEYAACKLCHQVSKIPDNLQAGRPVRWPAGLPVPFTTYWTCWFLPNNTIFAPAREVTDVPGCDHPAWFESSHCLRRNLGWMKLRALPFDQVFFP